MVHLIGHKKDKRKHFLSEKSLAYIRKQYTVSKSIKQKHYTFPEPYNLMVVFIYSNKYFEKE